MSPLTATLVVLIIVFFLSLSFFEAEFRQESKKKITTYLEKSYEIGPTAEIHPIFEYKITNIFLTVIKICGLLVISFLPLLTIRLIYLGNYIDLGTINFENLKIDSVLIVYSLLIAYGALISIISIPLKKQLLSLHFFLIFHVNAYAVSIERINESLHSYILDSIFYPLIERIDIISIRDEENIVLELQKMLKSGRFGPLGNKNYLNSLRNLCMENEKMRQGLRFLREHFSYYVLSYLPNLWHFFPEPLLLLVLAYDILHHQLYVSYFASLIYFIITLSRRIRKYYKECIIVNDVYIIAPLLYDSKSSITAMSMEDRIEIGLYMLRDFHHELYTIKDAQTREIRESLHVWVLFMLIPFLFFIKNHQHYQLSLNHIYISGLTFTFFLFGTLSASFLILKKIPYLHQEELSSSTIQNMKAKNLPLLLRILLIFQFLLYCLLFLKNCFLPSANEILLSYHNFQINHLYSLEDKVVFGIEYLNSMLSIHNVKIINPIILLKEYSVTFAGTLDNIREIIDTVVGKHIRHVRSYEEALWPTLANISKDKSLVEELRQVFFEPKTLITLWIIKLFVLQHPIDVTLQTSYIKALIATTYTNSYKPEWAFLLIKRLLETSVNPISKLL